VSKFVENGNEWESFVWKPRKPSCLNKDGTRDYEKLNALIKLAQEWDQEALMLVFEQYSGTWMSMCQQSDEIMYRLAMDYEDFQQEAFCCFLNTVKELHEDQPENLKKFFITNFKNRIMNILTNIEKQVLGHTDIHIKDTQKVKQFTYSVCSLLETNEDGSMKYDIQDNSTEQDYFIDYYPNISKLLSKRDLEIAIDYYLYGIPLKEIAKELGISYGRIRNITNNIKSKLSSGLRIQDSGNKFLI